MKTVGDRGVGTFTALVALVALIFPVFAAGCFGPGPGGYFPGSDYYPTYDSTYYAPPVYDYRGYGGPVVENRSAFGRYGPGRDVWADSARGRESYGRTEVNRRPEIHQAPAHYPQRGGSGSMRRR